jgi:hypothetical protein
MWPSVHPEASPSGTASNHRSTEADVTHGSKEWSIAIGEDPHQSWRFGRSLSTRSSWGRKSGPALASRSGVKGGIVELNRQAEMAHVLTCVSQIPD